MKFKNLIIILLVACIVINLSAHEGHNHDAPSTLMPLKGGIIKLFNIKNSDGKKDATCFVEVVKSKMDLKIYFFNSDKKPVEAKDFELVATATPFVSGKLDSKGEPLILTIDEKSKNFYKTSYDKKNSHKYDLLLKFKNSSNCKTDEEITFVID